MTPTAGRFEMSDGAIAVVHVALVTVIVVAIGYGLFDDSLPRSTTIGVAVGIGYAIAYRLVLSDVLP